MKKVRQKIEVEPESAVVHSSVTAPGFTKYEYTFSSPEHISLPTVEVTHEVDVPETLKEFREMHDLTKERLVEWLNKNYRDYDLC